jgi:hypothetical protein
MRKIPELLYKQVLGLTTAIVDAHENENSWLQETALAQLAALYNFHSATNTPDPFLTETLADFTDDAPESVSLYRLAILQSEKFQDEPIYTKQIGLASRLNELSQTQEAKQLLIEAIRTARQSEDEDAIAEAEELVANLTH